MLRLAGARARCGWHHLRSRTVGHFHAGTVARIATGDDKPKITEERSKLSPEFIASMQVKDNDFVDRLLGMGQADIQGQVASVPPRPSVMPQDRHVYAKMPQEKEGGKLTPSQVVEFLTACQRRPAKADQLIQDFGLPESAGKAMLDHFAVPLIYEQAGSEVAFGVLEVPDFAEVTGKPIYLGEHYNRAARQKQVKAERAAEDAAKNFHFN